MITILKEAFIEANNPVIALPGVPEGNYDLVVILQVRKKLKKRKAGFSKAHFSMTPDFNAALDAYPIKRIW